MIKNRNSEREEHVQTDSQNEKIQYCVLLFGIFSFFFWFVATNLRFNVFFFVDSYMGLVA
jgi:hypothetical protein